MLASVLFVVVLISLVDVACELALSFLFCDFDGEEPQTLSVLT